MIEIVVRIRCDACGLAVEYPPGLVNPEELPCKVGLGVPPLPAKWTRDTTNGAVFCAEHPQRLVQPVPVIPPGILRGT